MFMARVHVGRCGEKDMVRPGPVDPNDPMGARYQTCVDNPQDPKVFVVGTFDRHNNSFLAPVLTIRQLAHENESTEL